MRKPQYTIDTVIISYSSSSPRKAVQCLPYTWYPLTHHPQIGALLLEQIKMMYFNTAKIAFCNIKCHCNFISTYKPSICHSRLKADGTNSTLLDHSLLYRIEGNFGGGKHWRIWRMTINSPKFNPPIFIQSGLKSHARLHV